MIITDYQLKMILKIIINVNKKFFHSKKLDNMLCFDKIEISWKWLSFSFILFSYFNWEWVSFAHICIHIIWQWHWRWV